ncbi:MAG: hypothetical protein RLN88_12100 [Ekhidna sp.]|uniref:tetratricopeptide repeat protein n=1 Tax=Ekhidna sp. TaxID=2608089 RepID=UPI0032ED4100
MRGLSIILFLSFIACSSPQRDKIVVPELHAGFYNEAMQRINDELESDPGNDKLVDQKLFYCEQLGWPTTCISALDAHKNKHGMTNQLVEQYIAYYRRHERYQLLADLIDRWSEEYDLGEKYAKEYIECLTRLGRKEFATIKLRKYLVDHQSLDDLLFASRQYLKLRDTALAAYNLGKVYQQDPNQELMWNYGNLLIGIGHLEFGFKVLDNLLDQQLLDKDQQIEYARLLNGNGRGTIARRIVKSFISQDTITYLLAEWYKNELLLDSASMILQEAVVRDSTDRKPIWKLGRLYEDRGWFSTSLDYFNYLVEMNPSDTLAIQRIDLIQRKIAYLQRLKLEEANRLPLKELESKKIEN